MTSRCRGGGASAMVFGEEEQVPRRDATCPPTREMSAAEEDVAAAAAGPAAGADTHKRPALAPRIKRMMQVQHWPVCLSCPAVAHEYVLFTQADDEVGKISSLTPLVVGALRTRTTRSVCTVASLCLLTTPAPTQAKPWSCS